MDRDRCIGQKCFRLYCRERSERENMDNYEKLDEIDVWNWEIATSMDAKHCNFVRPSRILVRPWTHSSPSFGVQAQNLCVRDAGTPLNGTTEYG